MAHKTPSCSTKLLPKVTFDETPFVKLEISYNFKQNIDKTHSTQPMDFKNLKKKISEPRPRLLPNVCDFHKENHTLGYGLKNFIDIYSL